MRSWHNIICFLCFVCAADGVSAEYALRDGDTVVFLGDSITAARTYGKIVENYTLLRFPERKVHFINAGFGGDTAAGGLARLERDVFEQRATVLLVAYGTNDIGWGVYADEEHKQKYLNSIREIVKQCRERKVRVFICSAAVTGMDPDKSEDSFLQKMCDEGMALAREAGEGAIDVQRSMREIQKRIKAYNAALKDDKGHTTMHAADNTHLNDLGQLAMAFAILKGWGAPAEVSSVTLDANGGKLVESSGCRISDIVQRDQALEFTRLDEGRPINFGLFGALNFRFVPVHNELNRYLLTVRNLPPGKYEVSANGRPVGAFAAQVLANGLNIASLTPNAWQPGGPWDAEASVLSQVTDARNNLATSQLLHGLYLPQAANRAEFLNHLQKINAQMEQLQHEIVRPVPYRFSIRLVEDSAKK